MKGKTIYIIAAIAAFLVILVFVTEKPFKQPVSEDTTPDSLQTIKSIPVFDKIFSEDDCGKIQIFQGDDKTSATLVRLKGNWFVNPDRMYPAAKSNTERIFSTLKEISEGEVISNNPKNHIKFQVNEQTSTRVKFYDKNDALLEDVFVGKTGMNYMSPSSYVRKSGSDEVLMVKGYMMGLFPTMEESWRERTIFDFDQENITGFTIDEPGKPPVKIARLASDDWTCLAPETFPVQKDVGRRMANSFARLRASAFVDDFPQKPFDEYGLGGGALKISASLKDYSSTPTLYIGDETEAKRTQWYVRAENQDTVYLIYKYTKDSIYKSLDQLHPTPKPTPTPEKTKVVEGIQKQAEIKAEEINKMTEEEKQEAIQKKLDTILEQAKQEHKLKDPEDTEMNSKPLQPHPPEPK